MSDSFSETTYQSPFSRIAESFKGVIVGLLFCVAAPIGLYINEKNSVETAAALSEGASRVVTVQSSAKDASTTPRLIHTTGKATTSETLTDPDFGIFANAIKLSREVEMYQWNEEKESKSSDTVGGSKKTETRYEYRKGWHSRAIDSQKFKVPAGHTNPAMGLQSLERVATDVRVGEFKLSAELIAKISEETPLPITADHVKSFPPPLNYRYKPLNGGLQSGSASDPVVGDMKVKFTVTNPQDVSIAAASLNGGLSAWKASNGKDVSLLYAGTLDAHAVFERAQGDNVTMTWIFRLVGFVVMWIGVSLVMGPISTIARSIPLFGMLVGGAVGAGVGLFAFVVAAFATSVVIAIAWFAVRPVLSIGLVVGVLAMTFALRSMRGGGQPAKG